MATTVKIPEFSMFGGPLHWIGRRFHLVSGGTNVTRLGIALGLFLWGVLFLLELLQGFSSGFFSIPVIGIHVRLLLAIPLFFLSEARLALRISEFIRQIVRTGVVPDSELPLLTSGIRRTNWINSGWAVEFLLLLLAFALPLWDPIGNLAGKNLSEAFEQAGLHGLTYRWYQLFCLPFFRYLLLRWLWHLVLWWFFLWRLQQVQLRLIPIHPDRAGGIGYLEVVHAQFNPLILALSAVLSATFAGEVYRGSMVFESVYRTISIVLLLDATLFAAPFVMFIGRLRMCRGAGLNDYMGLAYRYVSLFDRKWIRSENASNESPLGSPDIQSLADLTNSVDVIRAMRPVPVGRVFFTRMAIWACVPFLPLLLFKYPLDQLALRLLGMLSGL